MPIELKCLDPRPMAAVRLVLFPFAGAGAGAFRGWSDFLPGTIEAYAVQLPGREDLYARPAFEKWGAMIEACLAAIARLPASPVALFGHSLGALAALDTAARLSRTGPRRLAHLFCAARPSPVRLSRDRALLADAPALSDDALIAGIEAAYGQSPASLEHPDIRAATLPVLRADLALLGSYAYAGPARLTCPIVVYRGADDPATAADDLQAWSVETDGRCEIVTLAGGHNFVEAERERLATDIAARLLLPPLLPPRLEKGG